MKTLQSRHRPALVAALVGLALAPPLNAQQAQKRPIAERDLFKFAWVADPQISPDGSQVAFVRVTIDEKKDAYDTAIWVAKTDGSEPPRPFTSGTRDTGPRWAPDGRTLAFVRAAEKEGRVQPAQIHLIAMAGGEPWAITDVPRGAGNPDWSPDGKTLLFTSTARAEDLTPKPAGDQPRQSDVRVITEAVYRANGVGGSGYVDRDRPSHIWTVAVPSGPASAAVGSFGAAKPLTSGPFGAGNPRWSRDGARVFFVSDRRKESYYFPRDSDLYAVSKDGGDPVRVVSIEGSIGPYAISPDGKQVAFAGSAAGNPERSYSQPDLWVADLAGGPARNLTSSYDFDVEWRAGRRSARAARPVAERPDLEPRRALDHHRRRRAWQRQPETD